MLVLIIAFLFSLVFQHYNFVQKWTFVSQPKIPSSKPFEYTPFCDELNVQRDACSVVSQVPMTLLREDLNKLNSLAIGDNLITRRVYILQTKKIISAHASKN